MIKRITIRLDAETHAQVLDAIESIPVGERNSRICAALRREFGGKDLADLAQAVHRLATAIEQMPQVSTDPRPKTEAQSKPLFERMQDDPALKARVKQSVLAGLD